MDSLNEIFRDFVSLLKKYENIEINQLNTYTSPSNEIYPCILKIKDFIKELIHIPFEINLNKEIIDDVLTFLIQIIKKIICLLEEEIINQNSNKTHQISQYIKGIILLVECNENIILYVKKQFLNSKISISSHIIKFGTIITLIISHCKKSEKIYGEIFQVFTEQLTTLFRKIILIHKEWLEMIDNLQNYTSTCKSDTLLIEIANSLSSLGSLLYELDMKTLADHWKAFAKFTTKYSEELKYGDFSLISTLSFLSNEIINNLYSLEKEISFNISTRKIKVSGFLLKILIKFCELFSGFFNEIFKDIFKLVFVLFKFSPHLLTKKSSFDSSLIDEIGRNLSIGADPLIAQLINDSSFHEIFYNFSNSLKFEDVYAFCLISNSITSKIIYGSNELRQLWLASCDNQNIIYLVLNVFNKIDIHEFLNDSNNNFLNIYIAVFTNLSALIISSNSKEFIYIEELIFSKILKENNIWTLLLLSDLVCILARTEYEELCLHHWKHLSILWSHIPKGTPLNILLKSLILRLSGFLSFKHIPCFETESLTSFSKVHFHSIQNHPRIQIFIDNFISEISNSIEIFINSNAQVSEQHYLNMVEYISNISPEIVEKSSKSDDLNKLIKNSINLWKFIPCLTNSHDIEDNLEIDFICKLIKLAQTLLNVYDANQLFKVLSKLNYLTNQIDNLAVMLRLINFLGNFGAIKLNAECSNILAKIFGELLSHPKSGEISNALCNQSALESFTSFAHQTSDEKIVSSIVALVGYNVKSKISSFLRKEIKQEKNENFHQINICFKHQCYGYTKISTLIQEKNRRLLEEPNYNDYLPVSKRLCTDINKEDVDHKIKDLKRASDALVNSFNNASNSSFTNKNNFESHRLDIVEIIRNLESILNYLK